MRKPRIKELADDWKKEKRKYVSISSYSTYDTLLETHILPEFGKSVVVSEQDVQDFIVRKLGDGLSLSTVKTLVLVLKMVLEYGAARGLCDYPHWSLHYPHKYGCSRVKVLSNEDAMAIINAVREKPDCRGLGLYFCLCTGLRIGELCALRWGDIDLREGVVHVNRTLSRIYIRDSARPFCLLSLGTPKTFNSIREIPLEDSLREFIVKTWPGKDPGHYMLSDGPRPIEPRSYRNYFSRFLDSLGIPHTNFHTLRHTFATRCIEVGADYKTVSALLGHADVKTTLNLYVHPGFSRKRECVNKLLIK